MTYAERRLAELAAIERELTEAEKVEVLLQAKRARHNDRRRLRYRTDPDYRERHKGRSPGPSARAKLREGVA